LEDFDNNIDRKFLVEIASPYFKSIFVDIAMRRLAPKTSDNEAEFLDNVAFFEYTKLPGIICDRFYSSFTKK